MLRIASLTGLFTFFIHVVLAQAPRTVLLEISESTWDLNTSSVICEKEAIKALYPDDVAVLSYHTDNVINGGDPLFNNVAENWSDALGVNAFARGVIDRVSYNGTNLTSVTSELWSDTIASRLNRTSIALVTLPEVLIDPSTNQIFARVQIDFYDDNIELEDYRFFCYISENGLEADQLVDTNAALCTTLPDTNDTAYAFAHQDVAIASPSGATGVQNIIPVEIDSGGRFTRAFTYNVPGGVDLSDLTVVGFVARWNSQDITRYGVLNAAKSNSFTEYDSSDESDPNHPDNPNNPNSVNNPNYWPTGVQEISLDHEVKVYPNPMSSLGVVEFTVPHTQEVSVDLYTMDGRLVKSIYSQVLAGGKQKAAVSGSDLGRGLYVVHIKGQDFRQFARLVKQ